MPCKSCIENIKGVPNNENLEEWLTQEQVRELCTPCYENMLKNSISRIKKRVLLEKLNTKMKFYEITYSGVKGSKKNIGGTTFEPLTPAYFTLNELPLGLEEIKTLKDITVKEVDLAQKPTQNEIKIALAKTQNRRGVMWIGASPRRVNEYGSFIKNQAVFDLSEEVIDILKDTAGFKII